MKVVQREGLEGEPAAELDDARGACRTGDLAIVARRKVGCGVVETHNVEDIGSLTAELELDSMLEPNVAEDPQVDIAEPRPI